MGNGCLYLFILMVMRREGSTCVFGKGHKLWNGGKKKRKKKKRKQMFCFHHLIFVQNAEKW